MAFFDRAITGQLVSRITNDTEQIRQLYQQVLFEVLQGLTVLAGAIVAMAWLDWRLMLIVLLLIVAMSWLVFWIDPEMAGPQISVAVTSMLTLIAYRFMVAGMLPRISYLTRMDVFTTASTVLVFLTLLEAVGTVTFAKRGHHQGAMAVDRVSRWGFPLAYALTFVWAFLV
jgi:ABC-type multidrug transport system fused ATPase/permease subunit